MNAIVGAVTFVYGHNQAVLRQGLWQDLCASNMTCPWILLGDFNVVMSQDERISHVFFPHNEIDEFVECSTMLNLSDAPVVGHFYTWNNRQKEGMRV